MRSVREAPLIPRHLRPSPALIVESLGFLSLCLLSVIMTWPLLPRAATHIADVGLDDQLLVARGIRETMDWLLGNRAGLFDATFFCNSRYDEDSR